METSGYVVSCFWEDGLKQFWNVLCHCSRSFYTLAMKKMLKGLSSFLWFLLQLQVFDHIPSTDLAFLVLYSWLLIFVGLSRCCKTHFSSLFHGLMCNHLLSWIWNEIAHPILLFWMMNNLRLRIQFESKVAIWSHFSVVGWNCSQVSQEQFSSSGES